MVGLRVLASAFAFASLLAFSASAARAQTVPATGQIKSPYSGFCAEIAGGSTAAGVKAVQSTCAATPQQSWDFRAAAAGGYQIVNKTSNLCLGIDGASTVQGKGAVQQSCGGTANQRWLIQTSGTSVEIRNANSGQCLEIGGGSKAAGASLSQWNCAGAGQQKWTLVSSAPQSVLLVNRAGSKCAHVPNGTPTAGMQILQWTCSDQFVQLSWDFRPATGGALQIVNRMSGLCVAVSGASTADNAAVVQSQCVDAPSQRFTLRPKGDFVEIVAVHSGKCIDNQGSMDENGPQIQATCNGQFQQQWTISPPGAPSSWSAPIAMPIIAIAASTLRNGKVLMWSAYDRYTFVQGPDFGKTYSSIFDPATNSSSEKIVTNTSHDMFCPGVSTLPDGRILVSGGSSAAKTSIYNPDTNVWSASSDLNVPRGYNGQAVLSTGEALTIGGSWSGGFGGKIGEVWNPGAGTWRKLPNVTSEQLSGNDPIAPYFGDRSMWFYGTAGGYAFHVGPSANMHWVDTTGDGKVLDAGPRGDDGFAQNGGVVMYDAGKLLTVGGAPSFDHAIATSSAYTIDISKGPGVPVTVVKQKPMAFSRAYIHPVVLPTGEVVVAGGQSYAEPFADRRAIFIPEIWSPATGSFTRLASMWVARAYHSTTVLLLDGRVLIAGGGQCGQGCAANHYDAQILTPPYLLNADGSPAARPAITAAPATATWGQSISVTTGGAVSSFAMIRLNAATHSVNNDQRRLSLPIASASGSTYQMKLSADKGTLIAGDWMLFAMDVKGTPSVAKIIRVQ